MIAVEATLIKSIQFPSVEFPAPPNIRFRVPDRWKPIVLPGSVAAVIDESDTGSFSPNLVVTALRLAPEDVHGVYDNQAAAIDALNDVAHLDELSLEIAGVLWRVWEYAFTDSQAGTLVQLVATTVTGSPTEPYAVSVIGSVPADRAEELLPTLRAILRSTLLAPLDPPAAKT